MLGMIIPPGDIKKMVEKTALHVAKNGSEFQKALIQIEQNKPQFSFLVKDNPYRTYYDHMVTQYSKKFMAENAQNEEKPQEVKKQEKQEEKPINEDQKQFLEKVFEEVKEPDPDKFTVEIPQKLSQTDLAMIQHTAQYVSIHGKNFLVALSERQKNNPQYQFLRSSSLNYEYFNKLVQAYKAILDFSQNEINILTTYSQNPHQMLEKCRGIYEYHRMRMEQNKSKKQTDDGKKQTNIDWNDFQLVQTIIFDDYKPKNIQATFTKPLYDKNLEEKIISEPKRKQMLQQCHICKKNILASQMNKHVKFCLSMKAQNNSKPIEVGQSTDVRKNLQNLSLKRADIFGGQGQNIKNEGQQEKYIWDGQNPNITRTTGGIAMLANQQKKLKNQGKQSQN